MKGKSKYNGKKTNKPYKSGKSSQNNRDNREHCDADPTVSQRINDASYYFWDNQLKDQLTNISFDQFNGVPNNLGYINNAGESVEAIDKIPYAMRFELSPAAGYTGGEYSAVGNAVNLAALNLYTTLSANNAKTSQYAPQDLTTLILGFGSIIEMASHITRAFGLAYVYNQRNRAFPADIIEAAGFDYDDLITNMADYRVKFNTLMTSANGIPIPSNIPYFTKCANIYSGIYWDMEGSDMAQTYLFVPGTTWFFNEEYNDQGTGLETLVVLKDEPVRTMDWYLTYLDQMIGSMLNSATLNAIYSDIKRVADKEGVQLYKFTGVAETYSILPTYEPEIRRWINNATICGYPEVTPGEGFTKSNDVVPSAAFNRIEYKPQFKFPAIGMDADFYINFDSSNPTSDEIVEATRLAARFEVSYSGTAYLTTKAALPDHYVNRIKVFGDVNSPFAINYSVGYSISTLRALSNFDWAPILYAFDSTNSTLDSVTDLNYYTTLPFDYVKRLQDATYLGLLTIR